MGVIYEEILVLSSKDVSGFIWMLQQSMKKREASSHGYSIPLTFHSVIFWYKFLNLYKGKKNGHEMLCTGNSGCMSFQTHVATFNFASLE